MMKLKVKFFGSINPMSLSFSGEESFSTKIEDEINKWLRLNPNIDVVEIKQSASGGSFASSKLVVSVWYRDSEAEPG
jgi:hypothetical protein